jgi:hypothetical protein
MPPAVLLRNDPLLVQPVLVPPRPALRGPRCPDATLKASDRVYCTFVFDTGIRDKLDEAAQKKRE